MISSERPRVSSPFSSRPIVVLCACLLLLDGTRAHCGEPLAGLDDEVARVSEQVRTVYRAIHEHPELGKKETQTQALIQRELKQIGYTEFHESKNAPTTVIAVLDTGKTGPVIALRADMDARKLPSEAEEPRSHDPRSQIKGVMHNCGHDAHTAMLIGAAAILKAHPEWVAGRVVFLFQPAEETKGGADDIVAENILGKLGVQRIFGQHVTPGVQVGTVSISPGYAMAGSNYFSVTVCGDGSHAAEPWVGDDIPLATATIVQGISQLPARRLSILQRPAVISITHIETGDSDSLNVLPTEALIEGTIRAFEDIYEQQGNQPSFLEILNGYLDGMETTLGVDCILDSRKGSPPLRNDEELFGEIVGPLGALWPGKLDTALHRSMFAEDFAFYTKNTPSLYFGLGIKKGRMGSGPLHTEDFTIPPQALDWGTRLMVLIAKAATDSAPSSGAETGRRSAKQAGSRSRP